MPDRDTLFLLFATRIPVWAKKGSSWCSKCLRLKTVLGVIRARGDMCSEPLVGCMEVIERRGGHSLSVCALDVPPASPVPALSH